MLACTESKLRYRRYSPGSGGSGGNDTSPGDGSGTSTSKTSHTGAIVGGVVSVYTCTIRHKLTTKRLGWRSCCVGAGRHIDLVLLFPL